MNYPILFRLLSIILAAMTAAFLVSFGVGEWLDSAKVVSQTRIPWIASIGAALVLTLVFTYLGRKAVPKLFRKEALAVIGVGWLLASALGALPYWFILDVSYADGFFESASGLTTTGATVFPDPHELPLSLLFWRSLSQWIGGLGVVVFFVAILSYLGAGAKILYSNEASGNYAEIESGRIQNSILHIVYLYLGLSGACLLALRATGMDWFDAVCLMLTTVCTGGFSNYSNSVSHFDSAAVEWVLIAFMTLGGISFFLLLKGLQGNTRALRRNTELRGYLGLIILATIALTLMLTLSEPAQGWFLSLRQALFQSVSILTTTGFATTDFEAWLPFGHVVLLLLMLTGGCSGSTSGGIKVVRIEVMLKSCLRQVEQAFRSRVVRPLYVNGRVLSAEEQDDIRNFIVLMVTVMGIGALLLSALEPQVSPQGIISASLTALCNVGPGLNEIGPTHTFADFNAASKMVVGIMMIMGRLELYALLALFFPSLWKRFA